MLLKRDNGNYDLIASNGKLESDVLYSIIREPWFNMWREVPLVVLLFALSIAFFIDGGKLSTGPNGTVVHPVIWFISLVAGMLMVSIGSIWLMSRIYAQYEYRAGRIGRGVEVLDLSDYFWHRLTQTMPNWQAIAREIEKQTLAGRVLEGIILDGLILVNPTRRGLSGEEALDWQKVSRIHQIADQTSQLVASKFELYRQQNLVSTT